MWLVCVWVLCLARPVAAHDVLPGALSLVEVSHGRFLVRWTAPLAAGSAVLLDPEFPSQCSVGDGVIDCGEQGLAGSVELPGLSGTLNRVVLRVAWLGGHEQTLVLSSERASVELRGGGSGVNEVLATAREFLGLGVEHILTGFDHLCFVLGLVLLVRQGRRLVVTVTAFTLAHSVTLALSALGVVAVPSAPVEATIALSIVLLALECAKPRESWTRRAPWVVAAVFGLLHGFGFAGALAEIGLPPHQVSISLAAFNLGVELGQLAVVLPVWGLLRIAGGAPRAAAAERILVVALGSAGVFWTLDRVSALLGWS